MFHTLDKTEISILRDLGQLGEKTWPYVELAIFDCYFMCLVTEQFNEDGHITSVNRSFLLGLPQGVSDLIDQQNENFKVININILKPRNDEFEQSFEFLKVVQLSRGKNDELTFLIENNNEMKFGDQSSSMTVIYENR